MVGHRVVRCVLVSVPFVSVVLTPSWIANAQTAVLDLGVTEMHQPAAAASGDSKAPGKTEAAQPGRDRAVASKMSSADRVNIRIQGYAALSGEYRINGDGTIALPGLGRVAIQDSTIAEFEARLANEIARISNRETSVAIEVVEYRPVFVSGVVSRVGAFPWKPGLSVLHAETLAGGLFRGNNPSDATTPLPGTDREKERAVRAAYELAATLATIERLKTEKTDGTTLILPARIGTLLSKSEQSALVAAQQATLQSRSTAFAAKVSAFESAKMISGKEKDGLEMQRIRLMDQLTKRRAMLKKIERLTEQGYARGDRLFDEQVKIAELEERLTTTALAISKMEASSAAAQQDLDLLLLGRNAEVDSQLLNLEQKAAQLEIEIDSANGVYKRFTGQDALASRNPQALAPSYEIVRVEGGKSQVLKADRSTALLPGDVLMVSFVSNKS